ncbi:MAG: N-acylglucosamine 2-epimerase [Acidobacteria bacterium]|nr:MAG: N-acylglucosamine 2-epimerase [Acidobacteriota bacterium]
MRKSLLLLTVLVVGSLVARGQQASEKDLAAKYSPRLEKILNENIIPYWYPASLDRENGGYHINADSTGRLTQGGSKMIVTQSRMVWFFSRLVRAGYRKAEFLEAADIGYRFLVDKMWDQENGGFYWEVDSTGNRKTAPLKHLYGQSFALYAISEYALASGKQDVLKFAVDFFGLLEAKAHDARHGGYTEFFSADWKPNPPGARSYMGPPAGSKLMNTHLHLMEAVTTFYRASRLPQVRERLRELIDIESNSVVRKNLPACTDKYQPDWTPILGGAYARVSYGHDVENVWLLMDACDAANVSNYPFQDLYRELFAYSHKYGYDSSDGGFYDSGPFNQPADRRQKVWWVQSEALVSALRMFRVAGESQYLVVFDKTLDFVEKHQVDWAGGEWHSQINENGQPAGPKASSWKAAYHNGRAMIECLELLKGR